MAKTLTQRMDELESKLCSFEGHEWEERTTVELESVWINTGDGTRLQSVRANLEKKCARCGKVWPWFYRLDKKDEAKILIRKMCEIAKLNKRKQ